MIRWPNHTLLSYNFILSAFVSWTVSRGFFSHHTPKQSAESHIVWTLPYGWALHHLSNTRKTLIWSWCCYMNLCCYDIQWQWSIWEWQWQLHTESKVKPSLIHYYSSTSYSHSKKKTIHQLTTMLSTSKNVLFLGHNHLLTTGADDLTLWWSPEHQCWW